MYQKYAIISAKKSRIKVSFLGETGTLSLEVSAVFLTGKMKKSRCNYAKRWKKIPLPKNDACNMKFDLHSAMAMH